ncbi:glycosyl transferase [Nostoc sp. PCC 7524]|uniref:glycosyltransferase family 2 protein n=1 Tax=Nostoc sp. (strain ATCC 29411 / PCC 7524) TaxID=28072 RepID=UPI00029F4BD2|nr:glycosyltransferase [Nostoc sp. PCC 7524]AFY47772.1 glycosyl transferase [Nostoc sp. PCC 7524]
MSDYPLISVILPFYNTEQYLETAIQSILNQTYKNFELLLLDDGSSDQSLAIAQKYAQIDPRVKVHHHPNMGLCRTLQKGVSLASGKYIARMDGDDIADSQRFELQVNYLEQNPDCVALGTALTVIDPDGDVIYQPEITQEHEQLVKELLQWQGSRICHPTVMMRTELVRLVGGYTQEYHFEDVDLFLKLAKHGKLANLPERMLWYRWHIGSISHTRNQVRVNEIKQTIYNRAIANLQLSLDSEIKPFLSQNVDSVQVPNKSANDPEYEAYCRWCVIARESGFYHSSFKYIVRIFKSNPLATKTYWVLINFIIGEQYGSALWKLLLSIKQTLFNKESSLLNS